MNFLTLLRDDMQLGLEKTPPAYRERHARWILSQQQKEGGFANRRGKSDLYYTGFALRSLSALKALSPEAAQRAVGFLKTALSQDEKTRTRQPHGAFCDAVASASWWDSLVLCEEVIGAQLTHDERNSAKASTRTRLGAMRRADGGWAKTDMDASGSLYHTLLAYCVYLRMEEDAPEPERTRSFIGKMAHADGGFLENPHSKRPGTNGTAAGVALSLMLADESLLMRTADFLATLQASDGGFSANASAPLTDLLSTYAGIFSLKLLGRSDVGRTEKALRFARELEQPGGGYVGFALESVVDCEYTYYGLGVESV